MLVMGGGTIVVVVASLFHRTDRCRCVVVREIALAKARGLWLGLAQRWASPVRQSQGRIPRSTGTGWGSSIDASYRGGMDPDLVVDAGPRVEGGAFRSFYRGLVCCDVDD